MQHEPDTVDQTTEAGAKAVKSVTLALQGGGAHGAFAWGALDRLLEDERLRIEAISATSAGAMNAVVMAYGYSRGGIRARAASSRSSGAKWRRAAAFGIPRARFRGIRGCALPASAPISPRHSSPSRR